MKPKLKLPGSKRLKLKCDVLLSNCASKFNLRRYNSDDENWGEEYGGGGFNPSLLSPGATSVAAPPPPPPPPPGRGLHSSTL
jgi:hypothetical protein